MCPLHRCRLRINFSLDFWLWPSLSSKMFYLNHHWCHQYDKHCHHHFCHICIAISYSQSSNSTTIIFKTTNTSINLTTKVMKMMTIRRVLVSARPISDFCHCTRLHLYTCSYVSCKVIPSSSKFDGITFRAINKHRRIAFLRIALWKAIPRLAS